MTDTLLIPCFSRPEFLWHCLDNLVKTGDLHTVHVIIKPDYGHAHGILDVVREYADRMPSYEVLKTPAPLHKTSKQSKNLLDGYQYAAQKSDQLVFMVEEDVMVSRDFFRYHRSLHDQQPGLFASLSTRNHNRTVTVETDPAAYYLSTGDYCSLGVCMRKEVIDLIAPHNNHLYHRDPVKYCLHNWPNSTIGRAYSEQDGLIRRIQTESGMPTAYPHVPRAFHAGYYGYNRSNPRRQPKGEFRSKVKELSLIIYNSDRMLGASLTPAYFHDSRPVPLDIEPWNSLIKKQPPEAQA